MTYDNGTRKLVITGGEIDSSLIRLTEELDLQTMEWSTGQDLPMFLSQSDSVPFGRSFLVVGGKANLDDNRRKEFIYEYVRETNEWLTRAETFSAGRSDGAAFMVPDSAVDCSPP